MRAVIAVNSSLFAVLWGAIDNQNYEIFDVRARGEVAACASSAWRQSGCRAVTSAHRPAPATIAFAQVRADSGARRRPHIGLCIDSCNPFQPGCPICRRRTLCSRRLAATRAHGRSCNQVGNAGWRQSPWNGLADQQDATRGASMPWKRRRSRRPLRSAGACWLVALAAPRPSFAEHCRGLRQALLRYGSLGRSAKPPVLH